MQQRQPKTIAAGNRKRVMMSARADIPGTLAVTFMHGTGLMNRITFGCSDPYVKVFDPLGNKIFETEHRSGTQNPKWEEEGVPKEANKNKTSLRLYEEEGAIRLEAWDKNTLSDAPLGQVQIPVRELIGANGVRSFQLTPGPDEEDEMVRANKNSLGTLTVRLAYTDEPFTTQKAEQAENADYRLPTILHLRVAAAMNLKNREATGTSDPYVTVIAPDGGQILKTPKMRSTLNPQFTDGSNGDITGKVRVKHGSVGNLTFQVWDSNAISDDPMGEVQIPMTTAVEFSQRAHNSSADSQFGPRISLILRAREREEDEVLRIAKPGELGTLMVNFKSVPETLADRPSDPPGVLTMAVDSAKGVIKRRVVGRPSHVVRVIELRPGDKHGDQIFETGSTDNSFRHPRWRESEATTEARLVDLETTFLVQLWDKGAVSDTFLGEARVTSKDALKHATEPESELKLVPRSTEADREIRAEDLGTIVMQFRFKNDLEYHAKHDQLVIARQKAMLLEPPGSLAVEVINCRGLKPRSENSGLDPYVTIIDSYGKQVHKTPTQRDTTEPKFEGEEPAAVRLAHKRGILTMQVWGKRTLGSDDFLGECVLTIDDAIAYVGVSNPTFVLRPRIREEDKWVRESALELGTITVSMRFSADQTPIPNIQLPADSKINGVFTVTIKGCKELNNFEATGTSDPFIRVRRGEGGHQVHKLPKCKNSLNPEWGAKNVFDVPVNTDRSTDPAHAIVLEVWDHNSFVNDRMGDVVLYPGTAYRYARGTANTNDVIDMPLRVPLTEAERSGKLVKNEHRLGTMQIQIEFKEGNDNKTAAEIEREELFNMDVPLEYVISHIERNHEASLLSRELMLYIPFLVMFIFFSLARRDTLQEHYIAGGFAQQFTLHEIPPTLYHEGGERFNGLHHYTAFWELQTLSEMHGWLEGVVAPHFWDWRHPQEPSKVYGPFGFNKALGAVRFRSRKMRSDSCAANDAFVDLNNTRSYNLACFDNFNTKGENKEDLYYEPNNFTVKFQDDCEALTFIEGDLYRIPCGGYQVDIPLSVSFNESLTTMRNLRFMGFTNETDTRFFVVEWFTYNPALDMFTGSRYFVEITNGGGWILTAQLRSFRVAVGGPVNFYFFFDIVFTLFVAYYWIKFFRDWRRYYQRTKLALDYLLSVWTVLEVANLVIFVVALGFHFEWYRASWQFEDEIGDKDPNAFPEHLDYIMSLFYGEIFSNAANSVLSFLKILKFLKMNTKLNILTRTMGRATENIMGVLAIFFLIMTAYALSGVQLYGTQLFEFRDVGSAMSTLFRALMGSFDYEELRVKNRPTTFFYFWSFIIIGLFVMLNFITAIIGSAYEAEQDAENTLPVAIQIRRTLRELKALSLPRMWTIFVESAVKRSRRHPDDIIFEHISQYRSTLLARDGIDEDLIRRGEERAPDYLINYHKFKATIPKADAEYIGIAVVDNTYHAIAEDFAVLHHDDEKETEDSLAVTFQHAIEVGFRKVLVDRLPEINAVQRCLLTGEPLPLLADQGEDIDRDATDEAGDAAVRRVGGGAARQGVIGNDKSLADLAAKVRAVDHNAPESTGTGDSTTLGFDGKAATEKLLGNISTTRAANLAPAQVRDEELIPPTVREEQRRMCCIYLETSIGSGRTGGGVYRAAAEASALTNLVSNVHEVTCARSYPMYEHIVAANKARQAAEDGAATA